MRLFQQVIVGSAVFLLISSCASTQKMVGTKTGDLAPDISATDSNGNTVTLSSLRGKIVLLEFWDSQNIQSRKNHSEIERLYENYKTTLFQDGNGLAVYSFSIDTDRELWLEAIKADRTTWPWHVCDFKSWNSKAALDYQLGITPKYYLIDGDGVIIKRNILIHELEEILSSFKR